MKRPKNGQDIPPKEQTWEYILSLTKTIYRAIQRLHGFGTTKANKQPIKRHMLMWKVDLCYSCHWISSRKCVWWNNWWPMQKNAIWSPQTILKINSIIIQDLILTSKTMKLFSNQCKKIYLIYQIRGKCFKLLNSINSKEKDW